MTKEKMEKIATDLIECSTFKEVAEINGISESSLRRLRKKSEFKEILSELKISAFESVYERIFSAGSKSANKLIELMMDKTVPASVQFAAAKEIISLLREYYDREEIMERLKYLENLLYDIIPE